ncbi:MAG: hypothetical protein A2106_00430 [Planctomycetes bacterium GWF2_40_8]|nr:MAG: hypothetical protein A2106_00430 [Planctomycetes bacterium GWF2_40_8]
MVVRYLYIVFTQTWKSQNQTGVNKLQISKNKSQTNFKLQCPNDQAELSQLCQKLVKKILLRY